ncbi:MAG: (2Fe-2S) ferredoxin domain-containing protein [Sphingomonadaceae bacterium]
MFPIAKSNWERTALVCAKCSKRIGGGFGKKGSTSLEKALKKVLGKGRKADFGVVGTKCLGVCPRGAVTMIDPRRPREWMIVRAGTPVEEVIAALSDPIDAAEPALEGATL